MRHWVEAQCEMRRRRDGMACGDRFEKRLIFDGAFVLPELVTFQPGTKAETLGIFA
jgi:hypothetical protein